MLGWNLISHARDAVPLDRNGQSSIRGPTFQLFLDYFISD